MRDQADTYPWSTRVAGMTPDERDDAEERAAILEFDAKLPRDRAEGQAIMAVYRKRRRA